MKEDIIENDCSRGCSSERDVDGNLKFCLKDNACKLGVFNWLDGIRDGRTDDLFEVRFKNTRKGIYRNVSGQTIRKGDIVVVEAAIGHDVGIVTLCGPIVEKQIKRHRQDIETTEFRKIYRKAKILDIERWQEAVAKEYRTMIRSRQIAAEMKLSMKIGDVEFQGDGSKAIFYYIADERVDFRQLIKVFVEEFRVRIEMKQIGARQEAGLIGGIGVCGQPLCCSRYMCEFKSITTFSAKCQDLSLNPQRLAGQCGKLKCCINYEAAVYVDAHKNMPQVNYPLEFEDGLAYLVKTDTLKGIMWFSYDPNSMANMHPLTSEEVFEIIRMNKKGKKPASLKNDMDIKEPEFMSAVGEDSISRFDEKKKKKKKSGQKKHQQDRNQNTSVSMNGTDSPATADRNTDNPLKEKSDGADCSGTVRSQESDRQKGDRDGRRNRRDFRRQPNVNDSQEKNGYGENRRRNPKGRNGYPQQNRKNTQNEE